MRKIIISQFVVLLAGVLFAWGNFFYELFRFYQQKPCAFSCTAGQLVNPIYTPCFYGAITFAIAFGLSVALLIKSKETS